MPTSNYPLVLLYHQIDTSICSLINHYSISINPKIFEQHIKIIKEHFAPIGFEETLYCQKENTDVRSRILLTFDDGYRAAIQNGGDILLKYNLSGIWFINSRLLNNNTVFWLSKLMWVYDAGLLRDFIEKANARYPDSVRPLNTNSDVGIDFWAKDNYSRTLESFLDEYVLMYGFDEGNVARRANLFATIEEIKSLSNRGEIGNHTASHPNIRNISLEDFKSEVSECHEVCERKMGITPRCFSYPFGEPRLHWSPESIDVLKSLQYEWIFSVENSERLVSTNLWRGVIPRHMVPTNITSKSEFVSYIEAKMVEK